MNHCFTLAYNLPSEVEKVTKLLYELNNKDDFKHLIIDLGFPLEVGDIVPGSIETAKDINSIKLENIAKEYGSDYVKMPNIGVSQNWTQVIKYLKPKDDDVVIVCDPDEHPLDKGWVKVMGDTIRSEGFGLCCLMMTAHINTIANIPFMEKWVGDNRVYIFPKGSLNFALLGLNGKFLNAAKEIAPADKYPMYGGIEWVLYDLLEQYGFGWGVLMDCRVRHTDYELGDPGTSSLLREWKNQIIFNIHQYGQLTFEEWLLMRKEGRI